MKQKSLIAYILIALAISPVVIASSGVMHYGKEPLISSREEANDIQTKVKTILTENYEKTREQVRSLTHKITKDEIRKPAISVKEVEEVENNVEIVKEVKEIEVKTNAEIIDNATYGISYSWQNLGDIKTTFTSKTLLLKYNFEIRDWEIIQEQLYEDMTLDPETGMIQYDPMDLEPGYYVTGIKIATGFQDLIEINNNDYETFIIYPITNGQEKPMPLIKSMDLDADKENPIGDELKIQPAPLKTTDKDYKYSSQFAINNKQDNSLLYERILKGVREIIDFS